MTPREEREQERLKRQTLDERIRIRRRLERDRGSSLLTLIHRKEPWLEGDEGQNIVIEDSEKLLMQIRKVPDDHPIDIILHTPAVSCWPPK